MNDYSMISMKIYDLISRQSKVIHLKDLELTIIELIKKYEKTISFQIYDVIQRNNYIEVKIIKKDFEKYNIVINSKINRNIISKANININIERIFSLIYFEIIKYKYEIFFEKYNL